MIFLPVRLSWLDDWWTSCSFKLTSSQPLKSNRVQIGEILQSVYPNSVWANYLLKIFKLLKCISRRWKVFFCYFSSGCDSQGRKIFSIFYFFCLFTKKIKLLSSEFAKLTKQDDWKIFFTTIDRSCKMFLRRSN